MDHRVAAHPDANVVGMDQPLGWARAWFAAHPFVSDPMLRQGAWYPVISTGATRTVLEIQGQRVAVPSEQVEIRPSGPSGLRWCTGRATASIRREAPGLTWVGCTPSARC